MSTSAYAASGVDIDAGELFVTMIAERVAAAWPQHKDQIGGFGGGFIFALPAKKATLSADGSGTMAIIAAMCERFDVIGQNAAAMSLTDVYVSGAQPRALVDILDVAKLEPDLHIGVIDGLIAGCKRTDSAVLVGGETAELPDMFRHDWMVNVNTAVVGESDDGIVSRHIKVGAPVYGWLSYGPASNGFSLIRKCLKLKQGRVAARKRLDRYFPNLGTTLADALLVPAPIWVNQCEIQRTMGVIFAAHAHITGGGLVDNIPRVLPPDCKVVLDRSQWHRPPIFSFIQKEGCISDDEMDRVFNQGLMMVSILDELGADPQSPNLHLIGSVEPREADEPQVKFINSFSE